MSRLRLFARAVRALWRVGLLRLWPHLAIRIWMAWRRCRGSLVFLAEVAAIRAGSRLALIDDDGPLTFAELRSRYRALARELIARFAAGPGRQIAVIERNHRSLVVALLAAARTGADVLLLNPDSPPGVLAKLLAAHAAPGRADVAGGVESADAPAMIILHGAEIDVAALDANAPRLALVPEVGCSSSSSPLPRLRKPGHLCVLTAGSTGLPKRIGRKPTISSVLPFVLGLLDTLPIAMHRPVVLAVPCFHGHGLATLAMALAFAAPMCLGRRYEIAPLLARAPAAPSPIVVSVPTLLGRWLAAGAAKGKVAAVLTGSAPLPPQLCAGLLELLGPVLYNLYGSSEAGVVSVATPPMLAEAPGTVGHPLPGTEVCILDARGHAMPPGQVGLIHVRGPLVVRPDPQGWLCTGDLGRLDDAGRLHICGRADGMFVSGGENVYPQEVEACLLEHPAVAEAAIAVVADAEFGARMRAFIVVRQGVSLTPEELRAWLRQRLDRHKQPRTIELVAALPRNVLGKIDRPALQRLSEPRSG
jgi:fatty-acyl-CoA synthase